MEPDITKAFEMLKNNEIQLYFGVITDPTLAKKVQEAGLAMDYSYGGYSCLIFNIVPFKTGELNPFVSAKVREAVNYIIDREYIVKELYGGMGVPKYTPIERVTADYARYLDLLKEIELKYSYDFEKGKQIIYDEMVKMGAELRDGKWYYNGKPVTLKFMIRITGREFATLGKVVGDYIAGQFEKLGFTVERRYMEASALFAELSTKDPSEGTWHMYYSGYMGWVGRYVDYYFYWWYTPGGYPQNLVWQHLKPSKEFEEIIMKLANKEYTSWEERDELFRKALQLAMSDEGVGSFHVWVASAVYFNMRRPEVTLTPDLAAGYPMSYVWPYTIRYVDKVGGTVKAAAQSLLEQAINPVIGALTVFDQIPYVATVEYTLRQDPFTGLFWPNVIKKADVFVVKDVAPLVKKTLDYIDLKTVDSIVVPQDAWYGWNATTKSIIYAPPGTTAKAKVVLYYEDDLFSKWRFHDGSKLTLADFLLWFPLWFERCSPESPHYDESLEAQCKLTRENFRGLRIVSENPLVVEVYLNMWEPDAEVLVSDAAGMPGAGFPGFPWHVVAAGILAEEKKAAFFSAYNADKYKTEWLNYLAGPSIDILSKMLDEAINTKYIPFKELLGEYVDEEEVATRYQLAKEWVSEKGHLWISNGPFYLDKVMPVEKVIVLKAFRDYPYPADRWMFLQQPPLPKLDITAPRSAKVGDSITVDIKVMKPDGTPYEPEHVKITYFAYQKEVGLIAKGFAEHIEKELWRIRVSPTETSKTKPGVLRLFIAAVSDLANLPTEEEITIFMTTPVTTPTSPTTSPTVPTGLTVTKSVTVLTTATVTTTVPTEVYVTEWTTTIAASIIFLLIGLVIGWKALGTRK